MLVQVCLFVLYHGHWPLNLVHLLCLLFSPDFQPFQTRFPSISLPSAYVVLDFGPTGHRGLSSETSSGGISENHPRHRERKAAFYQVGLRRTVSTSNCLLLLCKFKLCVTWLSSLLSEGTHIPYALCGGLYGTLDHFIRSH